MKWPTIAEAWMYGDPADHVDALMRRSARARRESGPAGIPTQTPAPSVPHDRYYRQARHAQIRRAMKGNR